jgi:ribosome-associated protein
MSSKTESQKLAYDTVQWALAKKAEVPATLDLTAVLDVTDFFVILTGSTELQVRAIADAILEGAQKSGHKPLHVEGHTAGRWVLIDFVDVVVHVMLPEIRDKYRLEHLWGDAPLTWYDEQGEPLGSSRNNEAAS